MTVSCLNCDTEKVYSTHTKIANNSTFISALQSDDFVIIHKNTLFGSEMDEVRRDDQFSEIFDIKLSNLSSSTNIDNNNNLDVPEHLTAQHQQVYQVLEKALDKMRLDSEVRIEQWKKVEMERLEEQTKIARQQSNQLWQSVLQANLENPHQFYRKSSVGLVTMTTTNPTTSSSIENSNQSSTPSEVFSDNNNDNKQSENRTESPSLKMENNTQSGSLKKSHVVRFKENIDQPKSNSLSGSYRRPSFSLDESAITNSLGKQQQESQVIAENTITLESKESNNSNKNNKGDVDEDDEDMFDLDEEIVSENDTEINDTQEEEQLEEEVNTTVNSAPESSTSSLPSPSPKPSIKENKDRRSSWIKKKKVTGKYIDADENDEESQMMDDHNLNDETQDLSHSISKYATSVPINIHTPMHTLISPNNNSNVVEPANEDPTNIFDNDGNEKLLDPDIYFGSKPPTLTSHSFATMTTATIAENINNIRNNDNKKTITNYDLSYNDRSTSRLFPDYNAGRRKSVATMSGRQPQLDSFIEKSSLDTRSMKRL
ncbi:unnamed protein product [Cunninghamella blakesleeana]